MAQKATIDGTAYQISGGKTLIAGTTHTISGGKTLIAGTGYDISFGSGSVTITTTGEGSNTSSNKMYIEIPGGLSTMIITKAGTHTIQRGEEIEAVVSRGKYIMVNGEQKAHASMTQTLARYTFAAETDISVYFGEVDGKKGVHITTT